MALRFPEEWKGGLVTEGGRGGGVKGIYGKIVTFYRSGNKYSIIENKNSKIPIIF